MPRSPGRTDRGREIQERKVVLTSICRRQQRVREQSDYPVAASLGMLSLSEVPRQYTSNIGIHHCTRLAACKNQHGVRDVARDPGQRDQRFVMTGRHTSKPLLQGRCHLLELGYPPVKTQGSHIECDLSLRSSGQVPRLGILRHKSCVDRHNLPGARATEHHLSQQDMVGIIGFAPWERS